jgi:hypothetical protein
MVASDVVGGSTAGPVVATYLKGEGQDSQGWFSEAVGSIPNIGQKFGLTTTLIRTLSNEP